MSKRLSKRSRDLFTGITNIYSASIPGIQSITFGPTNDFSHTLLEMSCVNHQIHIKINFVLKSLRCPLKEQERNWHFEQIGK